LSNINHIGVTIQTPKYLHSNYRNWFKTSTKSGGNKNFHSNIKLVKYTNRYKKKYKPTSIRFTTKYHLLSFCERKQVYDLISFIVFNTTFSNMSAISWRPVLVVEEAGVPGENYRPRASNW
jgi:hypothetical protein